MTKTAFSCTKELKVREAITGLGRETIVITGMEAHVCVLQTAFGIKELGLVPVVVSDASRSRNPEHKQLALERLRHHGVEIVTTEMVVFEWLERAGTPEFKQISPLIK